MLIFANRRFYNLILTYFFRVLYLTKSDCGNCLKLDDILKN